MDQRRFNRNLSNESKGSSANNSLQKKLAESRRPIVAKKQEQVPDLTDFMNDMFFGTVNTEKKVYNLSGGGGDQMDENDKADEEDFDCSTRSTTSKLTQEWLQEAKRMVATSPSQGSESPSRLVGSPRFAVAGPKLATLNFDRRDPLSRSARRHRSVEGFSGEILTKSAKHSRNNSESLDSPPPAADTSPASAVQKWFSNIINPTPTPPSSDSSPPSTRPLPPRLSTSRRSRFENQTTPPPPQPSSTNPIFPPTTNDPSAPFPPRLSTHRRSRFQNDPNAAQPPQLVPTKRTFRTTGSSPQRPFPDTQLLSPPKHLNESAHRRSISSSTCSFTDNQVLSPPRNLLESANRRSISSSTCSTEKILQKPINTVNGELKELELGGPSLNGFLKEQRIKIGKLVNREIQGKAKIVLSGPSNSTSSMVAAICYAWWLENKWMKNKEGDGREVVAPVLNVKRGKMWKQRQAAWLFHNAGVDATALLFADEVDLETLMMDKQLTILVVGQDILKTNGEVGSKCTILTDNYCEDAYDQLQTPVLKELLLAGILLDTQNLNTSAKLSMTRDTEAVQLLSVGSFPNYRNSLFDQLTQDKRDGNFFEVLRQNYGKPPDKSNLESRTTLEDRVSEKKSYPEAVEHNSDKDSNQAKIAKSGTMLSKPVKGKPSPKQAPSPVLVQAPAPASTPTPATDASRGKNKNIFAKWFGFGK